MASSQPEVVEVEQPEGQALRICSYDREWPHLFTAESALIEEAIGTRVVSGIHHVGSTAIAGVDAEPAIDILVGTRDQAGALACFDPLAELGYRPKSSVPRGGHRLVRAAGRHRLDLWLVPVENPFYGETLAFRELLRDNRQVALGYAWLKRDLVSRYVGDRQGYAVAKAELIEVILAAL
jgi:GrpB-like predicted nucleotidyltransferase (UPF0157 family)